MTKAWHQEELGKTILSKRKNKGKVSGVGKSWLCLMNWEKSRWLDHSEEEKEKKLYQWGPLSCRISQTTAKSLDFIPNVTEDFKQNSDVVWFLFFQKDHLTATWRMHWSGGPWRRWRPLATQEGTVVDAAATAVGGQLGSDSSTPPPHPSRSESAVGSGRQRFSRVSHQSAHQSSLEVLPSTETNVWYNRG